MAILSTYVKNKNKKKQSISKFRILVAVRGMQVSQSVVRKPAVIPAVSRQHLTQIMFRLHDLEDIINPPKNGNYSEMVPS